MQVTLTGVYVTPIDDYPSQIILNAGVTLSGTDGIYGEARRYASGRVRLVTTTGTFATAAIFAPSVTSAIRGILKSWAGRTVLIRDDRGLFVFGFFPQLDRTENPGLPVCDVSFALTETTHSIEV